MTYSPQAQLLTKVQKVDKQLWNFLTTVDNFLVFVSGNVASTSSGVSVLDQLITGVTTVSFGNPKAGQVLVVILQQDGTGHTVTWDTKFINPPVVNTSAGSFTTAIFVGRANGTWLCVANNNITYPLDVPHGGTGDATLTAHSVLLGEGTGVVSFATIGTSGRVLTDNGAGFDPSFQAVVTKTSFTPTIEIGGSSIGITYTTQTGTEYKIGSFVIVQIQITLSSKAALTGSVTIASLNTAANGNGTCVIGFYNNTLLITSIIGSISSGNSSIDLWNEGATGVTALANTNITNTSTFTVTATYGI